MLNGSMTIMSGDDSVRMDYIGDSQKRLDAFVSSVGNYMHYNAQTGVLTLGNSTAFTTAITNEKIEFRNGNYAVASIGNDSLLINNATVFNAITFGRLSIVPRKGGASMIWGE